MKSKIDPSYVENDRLIALAELERYKKAIEWLGNPKNEFQFSISPDGQVKVGSRYQYIYFPNLLTAIEAQQKQ